MIGRETNRAIEGEVRRQLPFRKFASQIDPLAAAQTAVVVAGKLQQDMLQQGQQDPELQAVSDLVTTALMEKLGACPRGSLRRSFAPVS